MSFALKADAGPWGTSGGGGSGASVLNARQSGPGVILYQEEPKYKTSTI